MYPVKLAVKYDMIRMQGHGRRQVRADQAAGLRRRGDEQPRRDRSRRSRAGTRQDRHRDPRRRRFDPLAKATLGPRPRGARPKGMAGLKTAIDDCKLYGGTTVLLVPGKVSNKETENFDQVWERSTAEIKKAIPLADEAGREDRHRSRLERLHHQARAARRSTSISSRRRPWAPTSIAATCCATACRRPSGSASSASGCSSSTSRDLITAATRTKRRKNRPGWRSARGRRLARGAQGPRRSRLPRLGHGRSRRRRREGAQGHPGRMRRVFTLPG